MLCEHCSATAETSVFDQAWLGHKSKTQEQHKAESVRYHGRGCFIAQLSIPSLEKSPTAANPQTPPARTGCQQQRHVGAGGRGDFWKKAWGERG